MKWTRRFFNQFEWLHKPISPIEESFMLPLQISKSAELISKRLDVKLPEKYWTIINGYLYFSDEYWRFFLQPATFQLPQKIKSEIKISINRWTDKVLPTYQRKIKKIKLLDLDKLSPKKQLGYLKQTADLEAWLFAESLFVGGICGITEVLLKFGYKLLVSDPDSNNYHELLIGFPDKGIEMDTQLWEVAQTKDEQKKPKMLEKWVEKYGYRIQDKDLFYPTLGEESELLDSYLRLYKEIPNPKQKIRFAEKKRLNRESYVKQNIRYNSRLFEWVLNQAQDYARIRNSRPFYYQGNQIMRQNLLSIPSKVGFPPDRNDIFFITIKELEQIVTEKFDKTALQGVILTRKQIYNKQLLIEPPFNIKA